MSKEACHEADQIGSRCRHRAGRRVKPSNAINTDGKHAGAFGAHVFAAGHGESWAARTNMLRVKVGLATLLLIVASGLFAQESPEFEKSSVVLRYSGNIALSDDDARKIFRKSIEILQSSNFNSSNPKWDWDVAKINLEYGRAVSGRHVLVSFGEPSI